MYFKIREYVTFDLALFSAKNKTQIFVISDKEDVLVLVIYIN